MSEREVDDLTGTQTTGHEWDGIKELNTPLPRWWLWTFYGTIVWAIAYTVAFPAWPMISSATTGLLGYSSRANLDESLKVASAAQGDLVARIAATPVTEIEADENLARFARAGGRSYFKVYCSQCHGTGAEGGVGYPNLNDDDWLWGGTRAEIHQTLLHGIRQPGDDATRLSQMPAFGRDGILKPEEIQDAVSYVRFVSRQEKGGASARRGAALYAANCAICHGADAKGGRQFGAPNLTDAIWLYGGDREALTATVANARYGVMPAWGNMLDPATINMLTAYVHSLGGGE